MKRDLYITWIGKLEDDARDGQTIQGRVVPPGAPVRDFCHGGGAIAFRVSDADARHYRVGERLRVTIVKKKWGG